MAKNWLFAGLLHAGKRAAAVLSLIQSVHLNRHEPVAYLRLLTQPLRRIGGGHRWRLDSV